MAHSQSNQKPERPDMNTDVFTWVMKDKGAGKKFKIMRRFQCRANEDDPELLQVKL